MGTDLLSTDRSLLELFRQGDREAMMTVWNHYYPLIRSQACRGFSGMTGFTSAADVDDAVSATFLAAFQERARLSYDGVTPYGAFLLGVGRNVMRRLSRKVAREPVRDPLSYEMTAGGSASPEEQYLSAEQRDVLGRFPGTLSEGEQKVFFGYYRDGLSEEKLAVVVGRTRYRVRKELARVEKLMKRYLARHGLA